MGRFLSRRLVRNIEVAVDKVRSVTKSGNLGNRLNLGGKDEVAFLTKEFDRLLDSLEDSQKKIIEAEKVQVKVQLAKEIAHNIKSPVVALEMMLPKLLSLPEKTQKVFRDSAREIKALADRLTKQADSLSGQPSVPEPRDLVDAMAILEELVTEKSAEFSGRQGLEIKLIDETHADSTQVLIDLVEFKAILSNLINNAAESYADANGTISVALKSNVAGCTFEVKDQGKGIPPEVLSRLGSVNVSYAKVGGKGVGIVHAYRAIAAWGGRINLESKVGEGTTVKIILPNRSVQPPAQLSLIGEHSNQEVT